VKLLLDTHVFLWTQSDPERLGGRQQLIEDTDNTLLVSAVTPWEIAIKYRLGRLDLPEPPGRYVPDRLRRLDAQAIPIEHAHVLAMTELPALHRDPFDRLLVAQAKLLDAAIVTADPRVTQYAVQTLTP
jgi:PIN domain nuclease of toxin-antitoxin system